MRSGCAGRPARPTCAGPRTGAWPPTGTGAPTSTTATRCVPGRGRGRGQPRDSPSPGRKSSMNSGSSNPDAALLGASALRPPTFAPPHLGRPALLSRHPSGTAPDTDLPGPRGSVCLDCTTVDPPFAGFAARTCHEGAAGDRVRPVRTSGHGTRRGDQRAQAFERAVVPDVVEGDDHVLDTGGAQRARSAGRGPRRCRSRPDAAAGPPRGGAAGRRPALIRIVERWVTSTVAGSRPTSAQCRRSTASAALTASGLAREVAGVRVPGDEPQGAAGPEPPTRIGTCSCSGRG